MALAPDEVTAIGSAAAVFTTVAFVPQVLRVWKLRDAREISSPAFLLFSVGLAVWLVYGLAIGSPPIVAANGLTLVLALSILLLKARLDRSDTGSSR